MYTLGIPLKQKRRTLGYLSNEYFPGGMKKLGQQVPYEIVSTDREGGFFVIAFPDMDEYEFRNITFQLKQQGVTVIGADSQLTENKMKLTNLISEDTTAEGTCGYGKDGKVGNEPAGQESDMEKLRSFIKETIKETFQDNPDVQGTAGMEDAVSDPSAKAEKILMQLAKAFPDIPLDKVVNDSSYKRQAITQVLFGMMD